MPVHFGVSTFCTPLTLLRRNCRAHFPRGIFTAEAFFPPPTLPASFSRAPGQQHIKTDIWPGKKKNLYCPILSHKYFFLQVWHFPIRSTLRQISAHKKFLFGVQNAGKYSNMTWASFLVPSLRLEWNSRSKNAQSSYSSTWCDVFTHLLSAIR